MRTSLLHRTRTSSGLGFRRLRVTSCELFIGFLSGFVYRVYRVYIAWGSFFATDGEGGSTDLVLRSLRDFSWLVGFLGVVYGCGILDDLDGGVLLVAVAGPGTDTSTRGGRTNCCGGALRQHGYDGDSTGCEACRKARLLHARRGTGGTSTLINDYVTNRRHARQELGANATRTVTGVTSARRGRYL